MELVLFYRDSDQFRSSQFSFTPWTDSNSPPTTADTMPSHSRCSLALALVALLAVNSARATGHVGDDEFKIYSSRPSSLLFNSMTSSSSSSMKASSLAALQQQPRRLLLAAEKEYAAPPPPARSATKPPTSASYAPDSIEYGSNFTTSFPSKSRILTGKAGKHKV